MTPRDRERFGSRQGATLVLVAVCMAALLGMAALAVDLGAGFAWRNEAQKIADSAALAGGSAFLDLPELLAIPEAEARALDYAQRHTIRGEAVQASEVTVEVLPAERTVRVRVGRESLPTWFARILGVDEMDVSATAAAQATDAGSAQCLKPIALPDLWNETDPDQDLDGDNVWDEGEEWDFDPEEDRYRKFGCDPATETCPLGPDTGYGSDFRGTDADYGRPITLKAQNPQTEFSPAPGIFFPWQLPPDPTQEECESRGGGGANAPGMATFRRNLCSCNTSAISLGEPYSIQTGLGVGPTEQGITDLIDQDPNARWVDNEIVGSDPDGDGIANEGLASPRVVKVALFDPSQITSSGSQDIVFNNFALVFIEGRAGRFDPIRARFLYYANGNGEGTGTTRGSLVRYLRLVE